MAQNGIFHVTELQSPMPALASGYPVWMTNSSTQLPLDPGPEELARDWSLSALDLKAVRGDEAVTAEARY